MAITRTWTEHTFRCRGCGGLCRASREALDGSRDNPGQTDEEVVAMFDYCLTCISGEVAPGEKLTHALADLTEAEVRAIEAAMEVADDIEEPIGGYRSAQEKVRKLATAIHTEAIAARFAAHGFFLQQTGGGCTAFVREELGDEELVTLKGTADAPTLLGDFVTISFHEKGSLIAESSTYTVAECLAALEHPSQEYHALAIRCDNLLSEQVTASE